jgi:hypothetical protein
MRRLHTAYVTRILPILLALVAACPATVGAASGPGGKDLFGCDTGQALGSLELPPAVEVGEPIFYLLRVCWDDDAWWNLCERHHDYRYYAVRDDDPYSEDWGAGGDVEPGIVGVNEDFRAVRGGISTQDLTLRNAVDGDVIRVVFQGTISACGVAFCLCTKGRELIEEANLVGPTAISRRVQVRPKKVRLVGRVELGPLSGVAGLTVRLLEEGREVSRAVTDGGGGWSVDYSLTSSIPRRLTAAVTLQNDRLRMLHECGGLGGLMTLVSDTDVDLGSADVVDFGVLRFDDAAARLWQHATAAGRAFDGLAPEITARRLNLCLKPSGHAGFVAPNEIQITAKELEVPDTLYHEYGHFVMSMAYGGETPVGSQGGDCSGHRFRVALHPGCAWSEGWAHFFALVAKHSTDGKLKLLTGQKVLADVDLEQYYSPVRSSTDEGRVAAALWDLFDEHDDANPITSPPDDRSFWGSPAGQDRNAGATVSFGELLAALWNPIEPHPTIQDYLSALLQFLRRPDLQDWKEDDEIDAADSPWLARRLLVSEIARYNFVKE